MDAHSPWYFNSNACGEHRDASRNPEATCNSRRCIHLPFGYPISSKYSKYFRYQKRLEASASVETPAWRIVAVSQQNIFMRDILLTFLRRPLHAKYCLLSPDIADGARKADVSAAVAEKIYGDNRRRPTLNPIFKIPYFFALLSNARYILRSQRCNLN